MDNGTAVKELLKNLRAQVPVLEELLERCSGHWGYEDPVYRFYHQSFKVYNLQRQTLEIVAKLQALAPSVALNEGFMRIIQEGTGRNFTIEENKNWLAATRPIVEAFFHARYFLEMALKYGRELQFPPERLPSGWAALLYLYNLR
ncbi:MAG: hypothetical protein EWM72_02917 [Nitrospira sp.]|nr:MAG: hypothetical protein EWM72_02917 [Nitrospira sp.]